MTIEKDKKRQLEKNREKLIREREPAHSRTPNQNWYDHFDEIFRKKRTIKRSD